MKSVNKKIRLLFKKKEVKKEVEVKKLDIISSNKIQFTSYNDTITSTTTGKPGSFKSDWSFLMHSTDKLATPKWKSEIFNIASIKSNNSLLSNNSKSISVSLMRNNPIEIVGSFTSSTLI